MSIIIFSGTTEGREISDFLSSKRICHTVCVATASGEAVMEPGEFARVHVGRLDEEKLSGFLRENNADIVVDATHPYAKIITENLKKVCDSLSIKYIRICRESSQSASLESFISYGSADECAKALRVLEGNILLATGSKELACYMQYEQLRDRLFVRVLPSAEAIGLCQKAGINEKHIIAVYGPHTKEMNIAVMRQFDIKHMVTKESGSTGGFEEKVLAASEAGVQLHVITRPDEAEGVMVSECIRMLEECLVEKKNPIIKENVGAQHIPEKSVAKNCDEDMSDKQGRLHLSLVGIGPGSSDMMTLQAMRALKEADYVFGAKRMLECYDKVVCDGHAVKYEEYLPEKIIEKLEEIVREKCISQSDEKCLELDKTTVCRQSIVILFSGDTSLFSGASKMYKSLMEWGGCDSVSIVPGISSFSAFAAAIGIDLTYAHLESLHGKSGDTENLNRISALINKGEKVFVLMSGKADFEVLQRLVGEDFSREIIVGRNISYPGQIVLQTNAKSLLDDVAELDEGLFICCIRSKYEQAKGDKTVCVGTENEKPKDEKTEGGKTENEVAGRVMIAAVSSGSGKTTITCGLLSELKRRGLNVKAYKCGPDYIDPMFHKKVIGIPSENLDSFFCDEAYMNNLLQQDDGTDIQVIEGAMGLYDGILGGGRTGSAYDVAAKTGTPIVLIVDAHGMGATLVSVIKGILADDEKGLIKGIILNKISAHYFESISGQIEKETFVPVLGFLGKMSQVNIDSRHLGLKLPSEISDLENQIESVRAEIEKNIDIDALLNVAGVKSVEKSGAAMSDENRLSLHPATGSLKTEADEGLSKVLGDNHQKPVLAVAYDEVFCFYYEENFRLLRDAGVELKFFSPLHDDKLPEGVSGILLGGGYPELKLLELSENITMRESIRNAIKKGMPSLAECGGFMYLHDAIESDGVSYEMAGVIPGKCFNTGKLCRFGYVNFKVVDYEIKCHEFHYFDSTNNGTDGMAVKPGSGRNWECGYYDETTGSLWGYPHLYYGSCGRFINDFAEHMREYQEKVLTNT